MIEVEVVWFLICSCVGVDGFRVGSRGCRDWCGWKLVILDENAKVVLFEERKTVRRNEVYVMDRVSQSANPECNEKRKP